MGYEMEVMELQSLCKNCNNKRKIVKRIFDDVGTFTFQDKFFCAILKIPLSKINIAECECYKKLGTRKEK